MEETGESWTVQQAGATERRTAHGSADDCSGVLSFPFLGYNFLAVASALRENALGTYGLESTVLGETKPSSYSRVGG